MKVTTKFLRQLCFSAGVLSLSIPVAVYAAPAAQAFQSRELGFRIEVPQNYTVDTSKQGQGVITLRNQAVQQAAGSDQPAPETNVTGDQPQISPSDAIQVATFENPKRLSAAEWAKQNEVQSFFNSRQSDIQQRKFAGQQAVSYSWCVTANCGDSIIVPSRDGRKIVVLSALYDFPGDAVRWDFQNIAGRFRFVQ